MPTSDDWVMGYKLPLIQHLTELRNCLVKAILGWIVGMAAFSIFVNDVFEYLTVPFGVTRLVYIAPAEGFMTYLKLTIYGGIVLGSPVILYQLLRFILPGMLMKEKKVFFALIPSAILLMFGGIAFGYFVVLPFALGYLLNFGSEIIQPMLSVQKYIGFVSTTLVVMGVVFETPMVIVGLTRLGIVTPQFLRQKRKYAIVLSVVVGAILTPPDVISQIMLAGPLIVLYEMSIWLSYLLWRKREKKKESLMGDV